MPLLYLTNVHVNKIPLQLFYKDQCILSASHTNKYDETRADMAYNHEPWVPARGSGTNCTNATGMSVEQLLDGLLVFLDGAPSSEPPVWDVL